MEASVAPGHALQVGVQRKLSSSLSACRSVGMDFIPLVAETLGEDTMTTISAIGKAISAWTGYTDSSSTSSTSTKHLFRRIAIVLWRGNASLWLHRQPSLPPSLDGVL